MKKSIIFFIILVSLLSICGCGDDGLVLSDVTEEAAEESTIEYEDENKREKSGVIYLCGAVNTPGVYEITGDMRLYEAVEKAGGLDEEADIDAINLAERVKDGESVRIPYYGETISISDDGVIDINSATVEQLCTIPGIGESRAKAIIEYREENGGFTSVDELMNISGIKEATFKKIEGYVCVR